MNCLQFFIFTRFFAVSIVNCFLKSRLWIAYNFLSLQGSLQFFIQMEHTNISCELLTIFYLYKVLCSEKFDEPHEKEVVNCLQFFIFTRFFAVVKLAFCITSQLWIAYNFLSLQGSLQSPSRRVVTIFSCELLTIFYLYKVLCSTLSILLYIVIVVNCLQFFIFTRFFAVPRFEV